MDILRASLVGGLLGLDGTAVGQFMVSRPLVSGALVGWLLGDPATGLTVGAILELYLLVSFPTGGARFPEGATATTVAATTAITTASPGALPLAVALGLLWGQVGGWSLTALRHVNAHLVPEPDDPGPVAGRVARAHVSALVLDWLRAVGVTASGIVVSRAVVAAMGDAWPLTSGTATGLLLVGGAVSAGVLLRDLGGFGRRRMAFTAGIALGILGARFL